MSDYAHNTMILSQLQYKLEMLKTQRYAELEVNAQDEADECSIEIQSIQEQIANILDYI